MAHALDTQLCFLNISMARSSRLCLFGQDAGVSLLCVVHSMPQVTDCFKVHSLSVSSG